MTLPQNGGILAWQKKTSLNLRYVNVLNWAAGTDICKVEITRSSTGALPDQRVIAPGNVTMCVHFLDWDVDLVLAATRS